MPDFAADSRRAAVWVGEDQCVWQALGGLCILEGLPGLAASVTSTALARNPSGQLDESTKYCANHDDGVTEAVWTCEGENISRAIGCLYGQLSLPCGRLFTATWHSPSVQPSSK